MPGGSFFSTVTLADCQSTRLIIHVDLLKYDVISQITDGVLEAINRHDAKGRPGALRRA